MQAHYDNYVVGFIDLLGQRGLYANGPTLIGEFEEDGAFKQKIRETIGSITKLQSDTDKLVTELNRNKAIIPSNISEEHIEKYKSSYSEMSKSNLRRQFWSDGVVYFSSLGDPEIKVPMMSIFGMLCAVGYHCFAGLALKQPVRGGLEIAWGVELEPGSLYGCAVAKAYELESNIAQYPRIVVGPNVIDYLRLHINDCGNSPEAYINRETAKKCRSLLLEDVDGYPIVHYLGEEFIKLGPKEHRELYKMAKNFINWAIQIR